MRRSSDRRFDVWLGAFSAALIALAFLFASTGIPSWIPPGVLPGLGVPSPLSGMTRSFVALAGGDVVAAFRWHPLGPVAFLACVGIVVTAVHARASGRGLVVPARMRALRLPVPALVALVGVVWLRQVMTLA